MEEKNQLLLEMIENDDISGFINNLDDLDEEYHDNLMIVACKYNRLEIVKYMFDKNVKIDEDAYFECVKYCSDNSLNDMEDIFLDVNNFDINRLYENVLIDESLELNANEKKIYYNGGLFINQLLYTLALSGSMENKKTIKKLIDMNIIPDKVINATFLDTIDVINENVYETFIMSPAIIIYPKNVFKNLLEKRIRIDKYYGLVNSIINYKDNPEIIIRDLLNEKPFDIQRRMNYIFSLVKEKSFNIILKKFQFEQRLDELFTYIEKIKYDIKDEEIIRFLIYSIDTDYVVKKIKKDKNLLFLINNKYITDNQLIKIYKKYNNLKIKNKFYIFETDELHKTTGQSLGYTVNIYIERELKLIEIIKLRNESLLYNYIINGGYLPYEKHEKSKNWFPLDESEREFVETYKFPKKYHEKYLEPLAFLEDVDYSWDYYINGDCTKLNKKLRKNEKLDEDEFNIYQQLNQSIFNSNPIDKNCIIYRGIKIKNFNHNVGDEIEWKSFTSCSSVKEISDNFKYGNVCCIFIIKVPKNAILLDITSLKKSESEIVIPPRALFDFQEIRNGNIILYYKGYRTDYGDFLF